MLRAALAMAGLAVAASVGGQIALPRVAERRITSDLAETGQVRRVSVEAMPAVKLLFKRADRVDVRHTHRLPVERKNEAGASCGPPLQLSSRRPSTSA